MDASDSCPLPLGKTEIIESESVLLKVSRLFDALLMGVGSSSSYEYIANSGGNHPYLAMANHSQKAIS